MRDYKNVRVPRKDRVSSSRTTVKRVTVSRTRKPRQTGAGRVFARLIGMVFIAAGIVLGWQGYQWAVRSGVFQVRGVDVKGVRQLTEQDIRKIAGVMAGGNIFTVDLDAAAQRARAHPWVKDVRVHRRMPDRISMVVTERVPVAILDTGKTRHLLDNESVAIARAASETAPLPLIMVRNAAVTYGDHVRAGGVLAALEVLAELSSRGGWDLGSMTIKADSADAVTLVYKGREIRIGSGNYVEKLRRLTEVMADVRQRKQDFAYIDLRPERQAAVMVRSSAGR
ncbi:MAG: hypothetical protein A2X56_04975 [Nitrospirae bacterium GWC2_57_13]|nr:MAG: hypothetical protein A2072_08085 [Nitrospirae bacterium GWC1_57_7]OGW27238.1 MAG: hypothetical protein A2X56_04975 [Nitrospirae bacterium GWC2_57_13]OGW45775.1 MAG: hypothetical protein A2X57_06785 [Nitrospirae bacterium GWD2_57_8]